MKVSYSKKEALNLFQHTAFGIDLITWLQLLVKVRFRIHPIYWPKALMISFIAFINMPFQLIERWVFRKKIKNTSIQSPVFILGYFRSGTTYLHYVLNADVRFVSPSTYQVLTPHLFLLMGKGIRKMFNSIMPKTRPQDNVKISADSPGEEEFAIANLSPYSLVNGYVFPNSLLSIFSSLMQSEKAKNEWKSAFHYFAQKVMCRQNNKTALFKSPMNTARIKDIIALYPDARFIHIHRNPYEVYASNVQLLEKILPKMALNKAKEEDLENFIVESYKQIYQTFLKDRTIIPSGNLVEMYYEDFEKNPVETLKNVYNKFQFSDFDNAAIFFQREINATNAYQKNTHKKLPRVIVDRINKEWSFMFDTYAYQKDKA